jgi:hypothetical protein
VVAAGLRARSICCASRGLRMQSLNCRGNLVSVSAGRTLSILGRPTRILFCRIASRCVWESVSQHGQFAPQNQCSTRWLSDFEVACRASVSERPEREQTLLHSSFAVRIRRLPSIRAGCSLVPDVRFARSRGRRQSDQGPAAFCSEREFRRTSRPNSNSAFTQEDWSSGQPAALFA